MKQFKVRQRVAGNTVFCQDCTRVRPPLSAMRHFGVEHISVQNVSIKSINHCGKIEGILRSEGGLQPNEDNTDYITA